VSRGDINPRVYTENAPELDPQCQWFALCTNPANGLCDAGPLGQVPICQRCDDRMEHIGAA
jgi:hypothetical protein